MPDHGVAVQPPPRTQRPTPVSRDRSTPEIALLTCGILAPLLYIAMNVVIPMQWVGYSVASQTISELSAIGAPTRGLWVPFGFLYSALVAAFGCGIWVTARRSRALRVAGALVVFQGVFGLFWPPMHLRGGPLTLTDTLHIVWTAVTLLLMLVVMGFAAAALGKRFRLYTIATVAIWLVFGTLTSVDAPRLAANLATPYMGLWERINAGAYMLWVIVLAVALIQDRSPRGTYEYDTTG
jgi:uncharacterized protein DUF998